MKNFDNALKNLIDTVDKLLYSFYVCEDTTSYDDMLDELAKARNKLWENTQFKHDN